MNPISNRSSASLAKILKMEITSVCITAFLCPLLNKTSIPCLHHLLKTSYYSPFLKEPSAACWKARVGFPMASLVSPPTASALHHARQTPHFSGGPGRLLEVSVQKKVWTIAHPPALADERIRPLEAWFLSWFTLGLGCSLSGWGELGARTQTEWAYWATWEGEGGRVRLRKLLRRVARPLWGEQPPPPLGGPVLVRNTPPGSHVTVDLTERTLIQVLVHTLSSFKWFFTLLFP